ncbi:sulfatase-like hydrolase/transferase [Prochlorococcus marinus]|uniref:sulfatase-like hydrolase/transferase n=1 Tax=Prochlorococcus marinus TaxID=1219 RepID=UPI0007BC358F|nr:sulfatase-like hydrolase/transferase [Prochlorococcus marinus]KZR73251.1 Arylsulfatase [Prochlorococcus marinus str. MIT 1320]
MKRPNSLPANLLLITFDQWRGDWGDPWEPVIRLPSLESLASRGWTSRRCYTSSPHCVPARFSWLTGMSPGELGVTMNMDININTGAPSIFRNLQKDGWFTSLIGKTHWTSHRLKHDLRNNEHIIKSLGFDEVLEVAGPRALRRVTCQLTDEWEQAGVLEKYRKDLKKRYSAGRSPKAWEVRETVLPLDLYPDIWIADKGCQKLSEMPRNKPWLLWVSFVGPHEPFDTPLPWKGRHDHIKLPKATKPGSWIKDLPQHGELQEAFRSWEGKLDQHSIDMCRTDYADKLTLLDDQIGKLLAVLKKRSDAVSTAVLITSDHGEMLGDSNMLYKGVFLEGSIRVPWVYKQPENSIHKHKNSFFKAVALTGMLKQTLKGLKTGGHAIEMERWGQKQKGAIIEFGREKMLVRDNYKLALDQNGLPLWAINLEDDPKEQINILNKASLFWKLKPQWRSIRQWAEEIRIDSQSGHRKEFEELEIFKPDVE